MNSDLESFTFDLAWLPLHVLDYSVLVFYLINHFLGAGGELGLLGGVLDDFFQFPDEVFEAF